MKRFSTILLVAIAVLFQTAIQAQKQPNPTKFDAFGIPADYLWNSNADWNLGLKPLATETVLLANFDPSKIIVDAAGVCNDLTIGAMADPNAVNLTLQANLTVNGNLKVTGNGTAHNIILGAGLTLTVNGNFTVDPLSIVNITGPGTIIIKGNFVGGAQVQNTGDVRIILSGSFTNAVGLFTDVDGTITFLSNTASISGAGTSKFFKIVVTPSAVATFAVNNDIILTNSMVLTGASATSLLGLQGAGTVHQDVVCYTIAGVNLDFTKAVPFILDCPQTVKGEGSNIGNWTILAPPKVPLSSSAIVVVFGLIGLVAFFSYRRKMARA
jgi:hypothetical protein